MTTSGMFVNFKETNMDVTRALFDPYEEPQGSWHHLKDGKVVKLLLRVLPKRCFDG